MSETDPELIERLLEGFVERLRRGETPSIAEYEALHPEHAEQIRKFFTAAQMMEQMAQRRQRDGGTDTLPLKPAECLGDYRIIREIGRGGMGVVYEAEQESLGRRVAVKVLPQSALLKPQSLRRFEREARTAARLHHSNIIPVFGVGEHQGFHYIVMQLIRGVGLDKILQELARYRGSDRSADQATCVGSVDDGITVARALLRGEFSWAKPLSGSSAAATKAPPPPPVGTTVTASHQTTDEATAPAEGTGREPLGPRYWESVARIGLQAAGALQYAHSRGTLHRDIKPANLLVDLQGVVWIGDFGLAKAQELDEVSQTGDIAGTLRYMAPERFHGQVDARSDIYSLGLSLYEMLTLRPAYANSHPSALMQRITTEAPPRPRAVNPRIPKDLETVVLKAIAREPGDRYPSAEELADDLERFLDDRPIRARRVGMVERFWRWSRRNRTVAALAGLATALLILVAVLATAGYVRTKIANRQVRDALAGESEQRQIAEAQKQRAEAISGLTLAALEEIFEQFVPSPATGDSEASLRSVDGEIRVPAQPVLSKEVAALLERMLMFYDRLAQQEADDSNLRRKIADANRRVGDIRRRLGHFEQAQAAYLKATDRYEQLERDSPGDSAIPVEIAKINNELGSLHWTARWEGEGIALHRKARDVLNAVSAASATSAQYRYELARTCYFLGRGGPPDAVPGRPPPGDPGRSPPPKPEPDDEGPPGDPGRGPPPKPEPDDGGPPADAMIEGLRSSPPLGTRDNQENLQHAIQLLESLANEHPTVPNYRHLLACCYRDLPPPGLKSGGQRTLDPQSKAIEILRKLADDFPEVSDFRHDLSKAYAKLDPRDPQFSGDRCAVAEERLRRSLSILERLVAEHPNVPDYAVSQVQTLYTLSEVLRRARGSDDGETALRKALARQSSLVAQFPDVRSYKAWQAILQESLAKLLSDRDQLKEARTLLETAIAGLEQLLKSEPQALYVRDLLGRCYANLADVLTNMGEEQQAAEVLRRGRTYSAGK
jgi:eukaryotic-like serine/threonine-protein kinase